MYKLLDDFNFQDNSDQLKGMLQNVFEVFKDELVEGKIEVKPIQYSLKANSQINVVCKEHNNIIQYIGLEQNSENVKQRLKCTKYELGKQLLVTVDQFFDIFSKLKEEQNKVIHDKRYIFIKQIFQVQEYFKQFRRQYLKQIQQIIQELNLLIINEISQETLFAQNQFVCLEEKVLIQMIDQILNFEDQKTFQEEQDLLKHQSAIYSMIIKNSTQINEIIMNQQSCLIELINQTSDELDQQTYTYQDKQNQITDYLVKVRVQENELQKENLIKQSI